MRFLLWRANSMFPQFRSERAPKLGFPAHRLRPDRIPLLTPAKIPDSVFRASIPAQIRRARPLRAEFCRSVHQGNVSAWKLMSSGKITVDPWGLLQPASLTIGA